MGNAPLVLTNREREALRRCAMGVRQGEFVCDLLARGWATPPLIGDHARYALRERLHHTTTWPSLVARLAGAGFALTRDDTYRHVRFYLTRLEGDDGRSRPVV